MNWIHNYVRPKIASIWRRGDRTDTPSNLWSTCAGCKEMVFHKDMAQFQRVCPNCGHHMSMPPRERFEHLFDDGVFKDLDVPKPIADPLKFKDQKRYPDRMKLARKNTSETEAMLVAEGKLGGVQTVAAAHCFEFMGGSMGMYVGNAIIAACDHAVERKAPLVVFTAAGGARMQEGILSLMQMPRTTVAVRRLKNAGLPYIVVLTHPTTGGVTASYAMLGDVHIAEPKALICFAGPRVIEQTIGEKLPQGFQRAEYLLDHGMLDRVTPRDKLRDELIAIIRLLMRKPQVVKGELPAPAGKQLPPPRAAAAP